MAKSADAFRTISEVADWLGVQSHVLRFWESKFTQVKPVKRAGGRRYYRPTDMLLLGGIRKLLHDDGLTIKGVQKILREEGVAHVADMSPPLDDDTAAKLDSDLAARVGDDVEMPATQEMPAPVEAAPFQTPPEDTPSEAEMPPAPADEAAPLPSFMRAPEPAPAPDQPLEERAEDVPTLTPDFAPMDAAPAEAEAEETPPQDAPEEPISAAEPQAAPEMWDDTPEPEEAPPAPAPADVETSAPEQASEEEAGPFTEPDADPAPEQDSLPMFSRAPAAEPEQEPEPEPEPDEVEATPAPRPRIVDAPDDVDIDPADIAPSVLTKAVMARNLTPAQRDALRPLVAQLAALRDQMARARHDPR
ncbi:MerR family transcriptional regulator [Tateyamaria armeniaca]|uniref:MerR family transcriptional regulator n=1 Tax=Tateyamaria armeniaca TaxID=2518930 RepID=A0ABW8UW57_9RHOB